MTGSAAARSSTTIDRGGKFLNLPQEQRRDCPYGRADIGKLAATARARGADHDTGEGKSMEDTMLRQADWRTEDEVASAVRAIVAEKLQLPADEVPWGADLESELGVDSLVMIEINVLLEERFGITLPEVTAPSELSVRTVKDLAAFVAARRARA